MGKDLWLVTGGAGFIGSNIAEELVRRGQRVRILDDFSTGKMEHIAPFRKKIELIRLCILQWLRQIFMGPDGFHLEEMDTFFPVASGKYQMIGNNYE